MQASIMNDLVPGGFLWISLQRFAAALAHRRMCLLLPILRGRPLHRTCCEDVGNDNPMTSLPNISDNWIQEVGTRAARLATAALASFWDWRQ